jgi:hypothetical protein
MKGSKSGFAHLIAIDAIIIIIIVLLWLAGII